MKETIVLGSTSPWIDPRFIHKKHLHTYLPSNNTHPTKSNQKAHANQLTLFTCERFSSLSVMRMHEIWCYRGDVVLLIVSPGGLYQNPPYNTANSIQLLLPNNYTTPLHLWESVQITTHTQLQKGPNHSPQPLFTWSHVKKSFFARLHCAGSVVQNHP